MTRSEARRYRAAIETAAQFLEDKAASQVQEMFPRLKADGELIAAGSRINWNGQLKRAAVDLWDTAENTPDAAPALWEDIAYRGGIRVIPEVITAGAAFTKGEIGWWGETMYCSLLDVNVYTPDDYPEGWEKVAV